MKTIENPVKQYFAETCPTLAARLDATCEGIATAAADVARVGMPVGGIVLGGGYGRGEGGIWSDRRGNFALHNDLDFFLFSDRPNDPQLRAWVTAQERHWTARLGIHVDFACLHPRELDGARESMMLTDLLLGYCPVFGAVDFLEVAARNVDPSRLPLWEASRLLWNRGSGLYFARCNISRREQLNFIERNQQKAALALGDALLCLAGKHHPLVEERGRRLSELSITDCGVDDEGKLRQLHAEAVDYKLNPRPVDPDWGRWQHRDRELTGLWAEVFLHVESARSGRDFPTLKSYAADRRRLVPEHPIWRNLMIALRDRRRHGANLKPAWDYPRAAVMRCLAALHDDNAGLASECLGQPESTSCENFETDYTKWWNRYQ